MLEEPTGIFSSFVNCQCCCCYTFNCSPPKLLCFTGHFACASLEPVWSVVLDAEPFWHPQLANIRSVDVHVLSVNCSTLFIVLIDHLALSE
jgi:hypothetical protein